MPCLSDDDLVLYAEGKASPELAQQIEGHLLNVGCRQCGAFVAWLRQTLPELPHAFDVAPRSLIEDTVAQVTQAEPPVPIEVEMMRELTLPAQAVRNVVAEERIYEIGAHRLELLVQQSLHTPFLDLVGLIDPEPPGSTEVLLLRDRMPIDVQPPDEQGRFVFAQLAKGIYEVEVRIGKEKAHRTPPFEARL